MNDDATYNAPEQPQTTGRFLLTFRDTTSLESIRSVLSQQAGLKNLVATSDFKDGAMDLEKTDADGKVYENLGIAVAELEAVDANRLKVSSEESEILSIEPEIMFYASETSDTSLSVNVDYLRGQIDGLSSILESVSKTRGEVAGAEECYFDDARSTWGLKATNVWGSPFSGKGVRVAVLDTGFADDHPDFAGRSIVRKSFIPGQSADDGNGHGTHCVGTACGPHNPVLTRRYGIAYNSDIFVGKVLSNQGSGPAEAIVAGIEWAVQNRCQVISMSLSAPSPMPILAFEVAGQRALRAGSLVIAAAGNNASRPEHRGFVSAPANSRSVMAVAAVDHCLRIARFSAGSIGVSGGEVDIAGPGVNVFSSWPLTRTPPYRSISGTSMATPHVAGVAALMAEAYKASGHHLWQLLTSYARGLKLPSTDVGAGLVQAPQAN